MLAMFQRAYQNFNPFTAGTHYTGNHQPVDRRSSVNWIPRSKRLLRVY